MLVWGTSGRQFESGHPDLIVDALGKRIAVDPATGLWTLPNRVVSATSTNELREVEAFGRE